jgi:hypothetical protein
VTLWGEERLQHYLTREGNHDSRLNCFNVRAVCVLSVERDFSNWRPAAATEAFSVDSTTLLWILECPLLGDLQMSQASQSLLSGQVRTVSNSIYLRRARK